MLLAIALLTAVHAKGVSSVSIVLRSYAETAVSGRSRVGRASSPRVLLEDPGPIPHYENNVDVLDTTTETFSAIVLLLLAAGTIQNGGPSATNMPRVTNMLPQRAIGTAADAAFTK